MYYVATVQYKILMGENFGEIPLSEILTRKILTNVPLQEYLKVALYN